MKLTLILVAVLCMAYGGLSTPITSKDIVEEEWALFKARYGKQYTDPSEESFRFKIFLENKHKIAKHNTRAANNGGPTFTLGMNKYGDMLHHEFVSVMHGFKRAADGPVHNGSVYLAAANVVLPREIDWREKGYVTPVKDQGQCGSCWSFSTTGALEGQHFRKTGQLVSLSEQNLVDCSKKYGNNGCEGGLMDNAFAYIKENHGIDTEASYPYTGHEGKCHYKRASIGATDSGFVDIPAGSETHLQQALGTVGPVSVAIDASHESFQFYKEGVYDEEECSSEDLDHGVLAVGYGTDEESGLDYWLVKNSWGPTWGQQGFVKMVRNKKNQCGIASSASYPLV